MCVNLRQIEIVGCETISDLSVNSLAKSCKLLNSMNISFCKKITFNIQLEEQLMNLQTLDLSRCLSVTDEAIQKVVPFIPYLHTAILSSCEEISDKAVFKIAEHCRHLRNINLSKCTKISDISVQALIRKCPNLTKLNLHKCNISDSTVNQIATSCPQLLELDLSVCDRVTDNGVKDITQGCQKLEVLCLEELTHLTDAGIAGIADGSKQLHTLKLAYCKNLTDASLEKLSSCINMKQIDLSYCNTITLSGLRKALESWPSVKQLGLRGYTPLTAEGIEHPRLEVLNLSWSKNLEDAALTQIAEGCPRLTNLDIAWCSKITDSAVHKFVQKSNNSSSLRTLNLRGCNRVSSLAIKLLSSNSRLQIYR